ncbi:hypothetical protein [Paraburkholderia sp. ZP32-5]|uniref:hypothetical protein n=1 Tax=Paraburkholderia sp. ZP32-5 TaxID=2883245 RepID=UPI001F420D0F|nr:hypothetical protein [Paraburkholderia sp. ZP32-5]
MKAETRQWRTLSTGAMAVAAAALLAAPLAVSAANGGVIRFVGMIVAPQLRISADAMPAGAQAGVSGASVAGQGLMRSVTFSAPPGVGSGADVAFEVNGNAAAHDLVAARFVDGSGRVTTARDGHYEVSRTGGVLTLKAKGASADTRVAVVVSYE